MTVGLAAKECNGLGCTWLGGTRQGSNVGRRSDLSARKLDVHIVVVVVLAVVLFNFRDDGESIIWRRVQGQR